MDRPLLLGVIWEGACALSGVGSGFSVGSFFVDMSKKAGSFYVECPSPATVGCVLEQLQLVLQVPTEEIQLAVDCGEGRSTGAQPECGSATAGALSGVDLLARRPLNQGNVLRLRLPAEWTPRASLYRSTMIRGVCGRCDRVMFPRYDKYPAPLLSRPDVHRVYFDERWRFAIWYRQPSRFREILLEEEAHLERERRAEPLIAEVLSFLPTPLIQLVAGLARSSSLTELSTIYHQALIAELCEHPPSNLGYEVNASDVDALWDAAFDVLSTATWTRLVDDLVRTKDVPFPGRLAQIHAHLLQDGRAHHVAKLASIGVDWDRHAKSSAEEGTDGHAESAAGEETDGHAKHPAEEGTDGALGAKARCGKRKSHM
jgi:hypothetical protein